MNDSCLMKIDYESRNLGIACYAAAPGFLDNPDETLLSASLAAKKSENGLFFAQARVSKDQTPAIGILERHGFTFIETALIPTSALAKNGVFNSFLADPENFLPKRYDPSTISLESLNRSDPELCATVRTIASQSFKTDRFHTDTHCPMEAADRRYFNWTNDLLESGADFDLLMHNGAVAGFMAHKEDHLILAGFAPKYIASGLGDFLWLSVLRKLKDKGITQVHTQISTNNLPVLNLYVRLGFKFKESLTFLHYWSAFQQ